MRIVLDCGVGRTTALGGGRLAVWRDSKGGRLAGRYGRSLFLTTAIAVFVCSGADMRPAYAQSVTGNGVNPGGTVSLPHWSVGGDLEVGSPAPGVGTLTIQDGGTVTNDTGFIGYSAADQGESLSRATMVAAMRRPGPITVASLSVRPAWARSASTMAGL